MSEDIDDRLRAVEKSQAVHEAVCASRYKGISDKQNITLALLVLLLGAAAAGNPVMALVQRVLG